MGALMLLARQALARGGAFARAPAFVGGAAGTAAGLIPGFGGFFGGDGDKPKRRRRRKMFTDTDLAQFAAAEGIAGRKAAATLMMIRAAKA